MTGILEVVSKPWRFTIGNWLCDSDLVNPTRIKRVLTEKDLLADSYSDLEASILDENEFLLLKVISTLPELSCLICSIVGVGRGTDGVALSMTHFLGRVTSSHFIVLGRETLAFVISVINKVVSPLCGFKRTLDAQESSNLLCLMSLRHIKTAASMPISIKGLMATCTHPMCRNIHCVLGDFWNVPVIHILIYIFESDLLIEEIVFRSDLVGLVFLLIEQIDVSWRII
ncbi:hypothetical protein HKD37_13G035475 [Glycine soja]